MSTSRALRSLSVLALSLVALDVSAQVVDLAEFERDIPGPRTQVLVLGSMHLSGMSDGFRAEQLEPLLERLARYKPEIITIEALSGEACDTLQRHEATYPDVAKDYCRDTDAARRATGLDVPAAQAEVEKTLAAWPASPTPAQRRHLAALFAAANDRASMVVQWLQLPEAERRPGDGLDEALVALAAKAAQSKNENVMVAAVLAARLGLQRVYPVDDHSADAIQARAGAALGETMQTIWSASAGAPVLVRAKALEDAGDMLAVYRFYNGAEAQHAFIASDFGAALHSRDPQRHGRQYVAWWETRNLRMVANIREAIGNRPGARVLSIVGASHKSYFDAYLGLMHDIDVVDVAPWLR